MSKKVKIMTISFGIVAIFISVITLGNILTSNRFGANTTVNGISIGHKTVSQVESEINRIAKDYTLRVYGKDGNILAITGSDIGLTIQFPDELNSLLSQQSNVLWPLRDIQKTNLDIEYILSYNDNKLVEILNNTEWISSGNIEPQNAYIADTLDENGNFYIVSEVESNIVDLDKLKLQIDEAIKSLSKKIELDKSDYKQPDIVSTNAELIKSLTDLNSSTDFSITYDVNGKHFVFDKSNMTGYISVNSAGKAEISDEASLNFVNMLNTELTTMGLGLSFKTTSGEIKQIPGGNWGWWLDVQKTKEKLDELIDKGEDAIGEVVWRQTCPSYGDSEFTNYVEIDLGNQKLYLYKDGELLGSWPILSGLDSDPNRRTPEGIFTLTYKSRNERLVGEDYNVPVSYWMPFNGNIGMHDAPWRSTFGGTYYKYSGSHGCVNMPPYGAKIVYENIDKTYAIICYY